MKSQTILTTLALAVALAPAGCGGAAEPDSAGSVPIQVNGGSYTTITPEQLSEMLKSKDFLFVNVHVPYQGEIEQTDAFIPFEEEGPQRVADYPPEKDARIVLYCRSGHMSTIVAGELVKAGYTNVWELQGGMAAWEQAGMVLLQSK